VLRWGSDRGVEPSGVVFDGASGRSQLVTPEAIARTLCAVDAPVRLVVLHVCYTVPIAEVLRAHVDCVVGMSGSIHDDAARSFAIATCARSRSSGSGRDGRGSCISAFASWEVPSCLAPCGVRRAAWAFRRLASLDASSVAARLSCYPKLLPERSKSLTPPPNSLPSITSDALAAAKKPVNSNGATDGCGSDGGHGAAGPGSNSPLS
jgi:hypothetical protein